MYINLLFFLGGVMFLLGGHMFYKNQKFILLMLLSLEFMVLSLFFLLFMFMMLSFSEIYFLMFFLVFSVCEGALGLSLLVSMIRTHGNNFFQSFNI